MNIQESLKFNNRMWYDFFDKIYLINLKKRTDRLETSLKILSEYEIPFLVYEAIENNDKPFQGLVDTMKKLFSECLEKGYKNILVFEDDLDMLVEKKEFYLFMEKIVNQIPSHYKMVYLGCNPAYGFRVWETSNLLSLRGGYATHAVIYSEETMRFIVENDIDKPLDNWIVREIQSTGDCYCSYPLLVSQRVDYSDIEKKRIDWKNFIEKRYNKIIESALRRKTV